MHRVTLRPHIYRTGYLLPGVKWACYGCNYRGSFVGHGETAEEAYEEWLSKACF